MSNVDCLMCACGSAFSSAANMKRHKKLCKKANETVCTMSNLQLSSAVSRIEAKMDMLLTKDPEAKFDISATTSEPQQLIQQLKITSSKPSISFEELCMKDFATTRNAMKLEQYALMGIHGIAPLFNNILSKYKTIPFKYINKPTKKTHQNEGTICKFEDNIVVFKEKSWTPMTRDDTNKFFYMLFVALENNYSYPSEDDDDYNESLDKLYKDTTEDNIYGNIIVEVKHELIDIIKTLG